MKLLLAMACLLASMPAWAQSLPVINIDRYCMKKSMSSGRGIEDFYGTCVDAETATYAELKASWSDYSQESRKRCLTITGSAGFYSDLQACIEAAEALRSTEGR
jgi:hypothetical protein